MHYFLSAAFSVRYIHLDFHEDSTIRLNSNGGMFLLLSVASLCFHGQDCDGLLSRPKACRCLSLGIFLNLSPLLRIFCEASGSIRPYRRYY